MFGQLAPLGTGAFELMLDTSKLKDARYIPDKNLVTEVNNFELEEENLMVPSTPNNLMGTPLQQTPGGMTGQRTPISTDAGFTPYEYSNPISPRYTPNRDLERTPASPYGRFKSPVYQPTSPGYSPSSNQSSPRKKLFSKFNQYIYISNYLLNKYNVYIYNRNNP